MIFSFCRLLKLRVGSGSFFFNEHSFGKDIFSSRNFKPQPVSAGVARKNAFHIGFFLFDNGKSFATCLQSVKGYSIYQASVRIKFKHMHIVDNPIKK